MKSARVPPEPVNQPEHPMRSSSTKRLKYKKYLDFVYGSEAKSGAKHKPRSTSLKAEKPKRRRTTKTSTKAPSVMDSPKITLKKRNLVREWNLPNSVKYSAKKAVRSQRKTAGYLARHGTK